MTLNCSCWSQRKLRRRAGAHGRGWKLDIRQSTRRALKYRRGKGEVLIVTHDGRGWWDPLSQAKGESSTWSSISTPA